jgi:hypothetical protein
MKSVKILGITFAAFVNGVLLTLLMCHVTLRKSQKLLLKGADVLAEPLKERFNEFIDILTVTFDDLKETVTGPVVQAKAKTKSIGTGERVKTTPGRYVKAKVL